MWTTHFFVNVYDQTGILLQVASSLFANHWSELGISSWNEAKDILVSLPLFNPLKMA